MNKTRTKITEHHIFDSPADFYRECERLSIHPHYSSWTGGLEAAQVAAALQRGDDQYVSEAEAAIKDIMSDLHLENLRPEWEDGIAGAIPNVPAFLAGHPNCMRRKHIVSTEIAPIKIFVSLTSSCGISNDILKRRGVCLLALVIALTRVRPVELWTFNAIVDPRGWQRQVDLVKMPTAPIDVGLISFILVNMSFTRGLGYEYNNHYQPGYIYNVPLNNIDKCRELVGAEGVDVVFPPIHLHENYSDPTKWVKERLQKILDLNKETIENLI